MPGIPEKFARIAMLGTERLSGALSWLAMALSLIGCFQDYHPVRLGTYIEPMGKEKIIASESELQFYVNIGDDKDPRFLNRAYSYSVADDGLICPYPATSVDAAYGIGKYSWYWDGRRIVQRDSEERLVKYFTLEENGEPSDSL
jgi:hypothetical protein